MPAIEVDGGIDINTAPLVVKAGATTVEKTRKGNEKKSHHLIVSKEAAAVKNVDANNFDYFTLALREHWDLFKDYCIELYGESLDLDQVDLKRYQDLLVYAFIKENIAVGSRIMEVGGGNSRLLKKLSGTYECWNIDKLDGLGNGPTSAHIDNVHLVKDYMGNFNTDIPADYFDFVFSVSVLEHVPQDDDVLFENIVNDINRVLKKGAYSLHLFDIVYQNDKPRVFSKFIPYIFDNFKTVNVFVDPMVAYENNGVYYLCESTYDKIWYKYTKKSYKDFGKPTSYNILWENQSAC